MTHTVYCSPGDLTNVPQRPYHLPLQSFSVHVRNVLVDNGLKVFLKVFNTVLGHVVGDVEDTVD